MPGSPTYIRAAVAADQDAIRTMIGEAHLNPMQLHWQNFIVAEETTSGRLAAVGQVKPHSDSSRELASIAVQPDRQGEGIAAAIIWSLLAREQGDLYLYCRCGLTKFYPRFGFTVIDGSELPRAMRRFFCIGQMFMRIARAVGLVDEGLCAMKRVALA